MIGRCRTRASVPKPAEQSRQQGHWEQEVRTCRHVGIVRVSRWRATVAGVALARMISGCRPTNSCASPRIRLLSPRAQRRSIRSDDGTSVINDAEVRIAPGEKVLVVGESGTGKSSLIRAIAGLWPWGSGEIQYHTDSKLFLLPQRGYLPIGSLRRALCYPSPTDAFDEDSLVGRLQMSGCLNCSRDWTRSRHGIKPFPAEKSSASPLPDCCCNVPTSSCSTRRRPRSIRRANTI